MDILSALSKALSALGKVSAVKSLDFTIGHIITQITLMTIIRIWHNVKNMLKKITCTVSFFTYMLKM